MERVSIVYPKAEVISSRNTFIVFMISGRVFFPTWQELTLKDISLLLWSDQWTTSVSVNGSEVNFPESLRELDFEILLYLRITSKYHPGIILPDFILVLLDLVYIFILFHFLS